MFLRISVVELASSPVQHTRTRGIVESKTIKTYQEIRRKHRVLEVVPIERDPEESGLRKETGIFLDEVVDVVLRHEMRDVVLAVRYL